jgi:hypothetical protein
LQKLSRKELKIRIGRKENESRKRTKNAAKSMACWAAHRPPKVSREKQNRPGLIQGGKWFQRVRFSGQRKDANASGC